MIAHEQRFEGGKRHEPGSGGVDRQVADPPGGKVHMYHGGASPQEGRPFVKDQVHIRNAEAAQLARALARQTGRTMGDVVLDALRQYRPRPVPPEDGNRVARWRRLLRRDRARLTRAEVPIEAFYDEDSGLPT